MKPFSARILELTEAMVFLDTDASGKCLFYVPSTTCWARRARSSLYEHLRDAGGHAWRWTHLAQGLR